VSTTRARSGPRTLLAIAAALGLLAALTLPALADHIPADGPAVVPTTEEFPGGDATCESGVAYRFNNPAAEDDVDLDLGGGVTATVTIIASGDSLTFEVTDGLAAVVKVKGGVSSPGTPDVNIYDYSGLAGGGIAHDDGLTTPSGQGISHVDFCIVAEEEEEETASPTPTPTPTPTPDESQEEEEETPTPSPTEREGELGGNPTPTPAGGTVPDTAMGGMDQVPATVLSLIMLAALAGTAYARLARQR